MGAGDIPLHGEATPGRGQSRGTLQPPHSQAQRPPPSPTTPQDPDYGYERFSAKRKKGKRRPVTAPSTASSEALPSQEPRSSLRSDTEAAQATLLEGEEGRGVVACHGHLEAGPNGPSGQPEGEAAILKRQEELPLQGASGPP